MNLTDRFLQLKERISAAAHSSRGRDVLLYLLFVCVAFVFWLMLSLDTEVQRDYDIPFVIDDMPDSVTFISTVPHAVNVGVQAKGSQLLQYSWGNASPIKIHFSDFANFNENFFYLSSTKLESRVRDYFGNGVLINNIRPDSIRLLFTTLPGEKYPIEIDSEISTNLEYILSGELFANIDSVKVYSEQPLPSSLRNVQTEKIVRRDLRDTTYVEVRLRPIKNARIIPDRVRVCIPVEALINKKQQVRIHTVNVPANSNLHTFPSKIEVSYLVPISRFKIDDPIKAYVDYDDIRQGSSNLPVHLSLLPHYIQQLSMTPDSVEYIIDRD